MCREYVHTGHSVEDSTRLAVETAGRSVLFAGTIVMIAMLGLTAIGISFIGALGIAAAVVCLRLPIPAVPPLESRW